MRERLHAETLRNYSRQLWIKARTHNEKKQMFVRSKLEGLSCALCIPTDVTTLNLIICWYFDYIKIGVNIIFINYRTHTICVWGMFYCQLNQNKCISVMIKTNYIFLWTYYFVSPPFCPNDTINNSDSNYSTVQLSNLICLWVVTVKADLTLVYYLVSLHILDKNKTHTSKPIYFSLSIYANSIDSKMYFHRHRPRSRALKELSLMSAGKPVSVRFTVTPPNRSTLPVSRSVPFTRCSWERMIELLKSRTSMRAGPDILLHNRPVSSGKNLRLKLQVAIIDVTKLTLVFWKGVANSPVVNRHVCLSCYVKLRPPSCVNTVIARRLAGRELWWRRRDELFLQNDKLLQNKTV